MDFKIFIRQYRWYFLLISLIPPLSFIGIPLWIYGLVLNSKHKNEEREKITNQLKKEFPNVTITPNRDIDKFVLKYENIEIIKNKFFVPKEEIKFIFLPNFYTMIVSTHAIYLYQDEKNPQIKELPFKKKNDEDYIIDVSLANKGFDKVGIEFTISEGLGLRGYNNIDDYTILYPSLDSKEYREKVIKDFREIYNFIKSNCDN